METLSQFGALTFGWRDAVQIAFVAFFIYRVLLLMHGTRSVQMLIGIFVLIAGYAVAQALKFTMITYLLGLVLTYGALVAVIVFQPELRAGLAHLGQSRVTRFFRRMEVSEVAEEIAGAVERLSRSGIGALIVLEREINLGDYVPSGTEMQAKVSADLLATIFTPYSPLHDGAVIIRGDTIVGAGCILPLSQGTLEDKSLGTRHRAALGLSEETDALAIVVSEETATISVAEHGRMIRRLSAPQVRDIISGRKPRGTAEHPVLQLRA
ncbi:MAG: diadenylate cyclase CdaA [Gemmatimonadaceae bacterium]